MTDEVHYGGTGKVEVFFALSVPEIDALAAHGGREALAKRTS
jgi:hypothetical protein